MNFKPRQEYTNTGYMYMHALEEKRHENAAYASCPVLSCPAQLLSVPDSRSEKASSTLLQRSCRALITPRVDDHVVE